MSLIKGKTKGLPRPQEVPRAEHGNLPCRTCASLRELDRRIGHILPETRLPQRPESPLRESLDTIKLHHDD
jgi:hypothetical protein